MTSEHAHGWRRNVAWAEIAHRRSAMSQGSALDGSSISSTARSTMPSTKSFLFSTWLYSDIASTPSLLASLRMVSDSNPPLSASRTATVSTRFRVSRARARGFESEFDAIVTSPGPRH